MEQKQARLGVRQAILGLVAAVGGGTLIVTYPQWSGWLAEHLVGVIVGVVGLVIAIRILWSPKHGKRRLVLIWLTGGGAAVLVAWLWWVDHKSGQLLDEDPGVRTKAAESLEKAGILAWPATDELVELMMRRETGESGFLPKAKAADALVNIGPAAVEPLLEALLEEENVRVGWGTVPPGYGLRTGVERPLAPLFQALRQMRDRGDRKSEDVRAALDELMRMGHMVNWRLGCGRVDSSPEKRELVPQWMEDLGHDDPAVRAWAAYRLNRWRGFHAEGGSGDYGRRFDREINLALAEALEDDDPEVRHQALMALNLYNCMTNVTGAEPIPEHAQVVPAIVRMLEKSDDYPGTRKEYEREFGWFGPQSVAAATELIKIFTDERNRSDMRALAAFGLAGIGKGECPPALVDALDDPLAEIRGTAANLLAIHGAEAGAAVPRLLELLQDEGVYVNSYRAWLEGNSDRSPGRKPKTHVVAENAAAAIWKIDPGIGIAELGLGSVAAWPNVTSLNLASLEIGDADLEQLVQARQLGALNLSSTSITDAGVARLADLPRLGSLNLSSTMVTDAGLQHVAKLGQLRTLCLEETKVTDAGLQHLAKLGKLRFLILRGNKLTDAGLRHLHGMSSLETLDLRGTEVTDEGIREFKQTIPHPLNAWCGPVTGKTATSRAGDKQAVPEPGSPATSSIPPNETQRTSNQPDQ